MEPVKVQRPSLIRAAAALGLSFGLALVLGSPSPVRAEAGDRMGDPAPPKVSPPPTNEKPIDLRRAARGKAPASSAKALPHWAERYDKPVYRNGRLVLWGGKWRKGSQTGDSAADDAADETPLPPEPVDRAAPVALRLAADPGLLPLARDLSGLVASRNLVVAPGAEDADLILLPTDRLPEAKGLEVVAKLFPAEILIVARPGLASLADLKMRSLVVGAAGSPSEATLRHALDRLNAGALLIQDDPAAALERLGQAGGPDAVALIGVAAEDLLAKAPEGARLISLPYSTALGADFLPATISDPSSARLRPDGAPVDTLAVGLALAAPASEAGSQRRERIAAFAQALFARARTLAQEDASPKWREVNLAAKADAMPRQPDAATLISAVASRGE